MWCACFKFGWVLLTLVASFDFYGWCFIVVFLSWVLNSVDFCGSFIKCFPIYLFDDGVWLLCTIAFVWCLAVY